MGLYNDKKKPGVGAFGMAMFSDMPDDDLWFELLQAQGAVMVDLQHVRLSDIQVALTEQEVEQALQILQEQPTSGKDSG